MTFEECKAALIDSFPLRAFAVIRYGQKQTLNESLEKQLEVIAETCRVDVAIAAEFDMNDFVLMSGLGKNLMSNCFPFLLSNVAVNILLPSGSDTIPGSYRLICYNTAQHVKKNHIPKICAMSKDDHPLKCIQNSVIATVNFVEEHVTQKMMENGSLRIEVYTNFTSKCLGSLQERIKQFMVSMKIVKEKKTAVIEFLQYMGSILANLCDLRTCNFAD